MPNPALMHLSLSLCSERYLRRHSILEENRSLSLSMGLVNAKAQCLTNGVGVETMDGKFVF